MEEAVLLRQGFGFASIHPSDGFDSVSPILSGAAHEAAAGHAFPDSIQPLPTLKSNGQQDYQLMTICLHKKEALDLIILTVLYNDSKVYDFRTLSISRSPEIMSSLSLPL